jgi:hypothetical protein
MLPLTAAHSETHTYFLRQTVQYAGKYPTYIYIHVHDIIIYIHVYIMLSHAITIHISTNHLNLQHQLYIYYINLHTVILKIGRSNHKSTHKLP